MTLQLPEIVETYFDINNGGDPSCLADGFCAQATVYDERRTHQGIEAIIAWQREAQRAFTFQVQPLQAQHQQDRLTVIAQLAGDFPGSPIRLNHVFMLEGDQIRSLEITPC